MVAIFPPSQATAKSRTWLLCLMLYVAQILALQGHLHCSLLQEECATSKGIHKPPANESILTTYLVLQARYKYEPFWIPTEKLFDAMSTQYVGSVRGFAVVRVNAHGPRLPTREEECIIRSPPE